MHNSIRSDKGNTLLLVFAFIVMLSLLVTPLLAYVNTGMMQSITGGNTEKAYAKSSSAAAIFSRAYQELYYHHQGYLEEELVILLADEIAAIAQLDVQQSLIRNAEGVLIAVEFLGSGGSDRLKRDSATRVRLQPFVSAPVDPEPGEPGPGPTDPGPTDPGPTDPGGPPVGPGPETPTTPDPPEGGFTGREFYFTRAVVNDNAVHNQNYSRCGSGLPPTVQFMDNNYDRTLYREEFELYASYYLERLYGNALNRQTGRPEMLAPLAVPPVVVNVPNTVTETQTRVFQESGAGLSYEGHVSFGDPWKPIVISTYADKLALTAAGDVSFGGYVEQATFAGSVHVGGNFRAEVKKLVIQGDLIVRGDMTLGQIGDEVIIEGNLIVAGKLSVSGRKLTVQGNIQVGGQMDILQIYNEMTIGGSVQVQGNAAFNNNMEKLTVRGDLLSAGRLTFPRIGSMTVEGTISAQSDLTFGGYVAEFSVGRWQSGAIVAGSPNGALVSGTQITMNGTGTMRVSGTMSAPIITFRGEVKVVNIGGSLITGSGISVTSEIVDWQIGEHLVVGGTIDLRSMRLLQVGKSIYTGERLVFADVKDGVTVGGSIIAKGDIQFTNTVSRVEVGKDMISYGSISFETISRTLRTEGFMMALQDIAFNNNMTSSANRLGGFYAGNRTSFPNWYQWGSGKDAVCVQYKAPDIQIVSRGD